MADEGIRDQRVSAARFLASRTGILAREINAAIEHAGELHRQWRHLVGETANQDAAGALQALADVDDHLIRARDAAMQSGELMLDYVHVL